MPLHFTHEQDDAMRGHAVRDYPHECCGFLVGRAQGEAVTLARVVPAGRSHAGIVIAVRRPPYELAKHVLVILNAVTADEMHNQMRYI